MHQDVELDEIPPYSDGVAFVQFILNTPILHRCRCGGAEIEMPLKHVGPVHCGEAQCEILPRLEPKPGYSPGDLRALFERNTSSSQ